MAAPFSRKKIIFLIRLTVILTTGYFMIFSPSAGTGLQTRGYLFIVFYLLTNLIVAYIPDKYFYDDRIFYGFILCDSILLPAGIYLSGYVGSDLYLMFFFIISLTTMSDRFGHLMINTFFFSIIYAWLLYERGALTGPQATSYWIQIPFIIVIAMFYGYLVTTRLQDKDEKINEVRSRYEQIVQATDVFMCIVDREGKIIFANPKIISFYGYRNPSDLIGLPLSRLYSEDEPETEKTLTQVKSVFERKETTRYESFDKKHGIWLAHTLSPIKNAATGDVSAVCIISKDITDRVEKENKLNNTIELLIKTRDQLMQQDKMAALGRMASGIAHEIRNPLEIIYMGIDYLENNIPDDQVQFREAVEKMYQAANRADNIIKNILSFSRKSEWKIVQLPICPLLKKTLELARQSFQKKNVEVRLECADESLEVAADYNMLEHLFLNLFENAADAMADRKERILTLRAYKKKITEIGYKTGYRYTDFFRIGEDMVVVEVSDTGKGIPKDVLPKIFEPFFTTKPVNEGTGLGLSIAHMIIERLSGTIDVTSEENVGTTFFVKLQPELKFIKPQEA
jgi:PAS domain S-box-containing protein